MSLCYRHRRPLQDSVPCPNGASAPVGRAPAPSPAPPLHSAPRSLSASDSCARGVTPRRAGSRRARPRRAECNEHVTEGRRGRLFSVSFRPVRVSRGGGDGWWLHPRPSREPSAWASGRRAGVGLRAPAAGSRGRRWEAGLPVPGAGMGAAEPGPVTFPPFLRRARGSASIPPSPPSPRAAQRADDGVSSGRPFPPVTRQERRQSHRQANRSSGGGRPRRPPPTPRECERPWPRRARRGPVRPPPPTCAVAE